MLQQCHLDDKEKNPTFSPSFPLPPAYCPLPSSLLPPPLLPLLSLLSLLLPYFWSPMFSKLIERTRICCCYSFSWEFHLDENCLVDCELLTLVLGWMAFSTAGKPRNRCCALLLLSATPAGQGALYHSSGHSFLPVRSSVLVISPLAEITLMQLVLTAAH